MTNITQGMNIEEVRRLAVDLKDLGDRMDDIAKRLDRSVSNATWVGPDAQAFKNDWWPGHRGHLTKVAVDLRGFGQSASNNADEQERVSGVAGRGSHSGAIAPGHGDVGIHDPRPVAPTAPPKSVSLGLADVGHRYPTGWNQQGECVKSVQRWVNTATGKDVYVGGHGPVGSLQASGAHQIGDISTAQPGDIIQIAKGDSWDGVPHTVLVTKNLGNGHFSIVQSNAPGWVNGEHITSNYAGLVTTVDDWNVSDHIPSGENATAWRF